MKTKHSILTLSLLSLVLSCQDKPDPTKDEITTVHGTVVEYGTNIPIEGATVKMIDRESGRDTVAKTITDANGKFSYSHKGPINFGLCSYIFKDLYFTEQGTDGPGTDKMCHRWGVENNPVLETKPYAWLKLRLINESGASSVIINGPPGSEKNGIYFSGSITDTIVHFRVWGNYNEKIPVFINYDTAQEKKLIPYYAPGHDTAFYEIKY